jgi:hypothetical protein
MPAMTPVPPPAAPERPGAVLRRAGVLADGDVVDVTVETARDTLISHIARLRVTYGGSGQITTPMWQANHGLVPVIWWNNLERIMVAVHDLGCLDLLD